MIRNIQISAFVDHSTPYKNVEDDKRIIGGAVQWLRLGIFPVVAITPDGPYFEFVKELPPGTILAVKLGNRMSGIADIDGAARIAAAIAACGYRGELRAENESMLQNHWRNSNVPLSTDVTKTLRKLRLDGVRWTWQTGFFEPFQLGMDVPQSRTFNRMKTVAKAVRDVLGARFVTNRLAKPPTLKNTTPGKPDFFNNDWYSVKAAESAAPFIDADHPEVCQVYSNKLYGKGGKTCRYWLQEEYGQALQLGRISGADIAFDPGAGGWDDQTELDAWERAIEEARRDEGTERRRAGRAIAIATRAAAAAGGGGDRRGECAGGGSTAGNSSAAADGGAMSEQATPKPPWRRNTDTTLETAVQFLYLERFERLAERAWSELCALQAVAEAAEAWDSDSLQAPQLRFALKEWRAICPR